MPEKTDGDGAASAALARFVTERVAPLAKAFAATPLMELRVRTPEGSIRLVKSADAHAHPRAGARSTQRSAPKQPLMPSTQAGHPYDVITADVVGIFTPTPEPTEPGGLIAEDQVLGYIEALKLKHPVRSGAPAVLISQVVEDGQAVDFGETLFVVDRAEAAKIATAPQTPPAQPAELLEPPRL